MPETKTMFSRAMPELGHEALDRGQDRVVTAAGAPAHLLVGLEVLGLQLGCFAGDRCAIASAIGPQPACRFDGGHSGRRGPIGR